MPKAGVIMRRTILIVLLSVTSLNAMAELILVTTDEIKVTYADPTSIIKHENIVEMSGLFDFKIAHTSDANMSYKSLKFHDEYNCNERQKRNLDISVHAENMGKGETISSYSEPSKWQTVVGVGESLWKVACRVK
jgi:hypothetical protein